MEQLSPILASLTTESLPHSAITNAEMWPLAVYFLSSLCHHILTDF